jgi:hypothetical protein
MSGYWTPLRDESRRYWQRVRNQREAEERSRREWISEVKQRLGIVCWGDEAPSRPLPDWPALPEGTRPGDWKVVSEQAVASRDGINFYVKPEGMPLTEWWDSIP